MFDRRAFVVLGTLLVNAACVTNEPTRKAYEERLNSSFGKIEAGDPQGAKECLADVEYLKGEDGYKDMEFNTPKGKLSWSGVKKHCESSLKTASVQRTGCGKSHIDIKFSESGGVATAPTFHPASMGGEYTPSKKAFYEAVPCDQMPAKSAPGQYKKFESTIKNICGKAARIVSKETISRKLVSAGNYESSGVFTCFIKAKANWSEGYQPK